MALVPFGMGRPVRWKQVIPIPSALKTLKPPKTLRPLLNLQILKLL
jgi:hypothetical protein